MASRKSRSKKRPRRAARKPARMRKAAARRSTRARRKAGAPKAARRRRPAMAKPRGPAPVPASPPRDDLARERARLSRHRGDDMRLAASDAEQRADEQRSRDDVHERDLSGS